MKLQVNPCETMLLDFFCTCSLCIIEETVFIKAMIRSIRIKLDTVENHVIWCRAPGGRNLPRGFAKSHDRQLCSERGDQVETGDLYPVRLLALKSNFKEFGTRIQGFV